jgi:hypothetical protein
MTKIVDNKIVRDRMAHRPTTPAAGRGFATYGHDRVTLHLKHFECAEAPNAYRRGGHLEERAFARRAISPAACSGNGNTELTLISQST